MLQKEIELVENYLELEKLRYGKNLKAEFIKSGNFKSKQVAPMLVLPFIENAFKHGISGQPDASFVKINAFVDDENFIFSVENSKSDNHIISSRESYKEGIGLKNVKRRLELQYRGKYELEVKDEKDLFSVKMTLRISDLDQKNETTKIEELQEA